MKNFALIIILLFGLTIHAQVYREGYNNHELRFNMGRFLTTAVIDVSYEYYFTPYASFGGTTFYNSGAVGTRANFGIGPNLRAYFGYNPKMGIFAEAFGLYYSGDIDTTNNLGSRDNDYSTTAIGLGLGRKWSTFGEKLSFEVSAGLGRNINQHEFQNSFLFRSGISVGIRF